MSINYCLDKQKVVYQYNIIVFSHTNKWNADNQHFKVDEPQNHHTKWKKSIVKGHIFYDSIYIQNPESQKAD